MKCTLMDKNVPIVDLDLDDDTAAIIKVITHRSYCHSSKGANRRITKNGGET